MKKVMVGFIMLVMLAIPGYAFSGGLWSMAKNAGLEKIQSNAYVIEVKGTNIRAYVFDVKEMKSVCINVWGSNNQTLECKTYKEMGITDNTDKTDK